MTCGAEYFLDELNERQIPRFLIIESKNKDLDFYFENFGINKWFSHEKIICVDNIVPGKPDKSFYDKVVHSISLPVKNCIVLENSISGIYAAKEAGIGEIIVITSEDKKYTFEYMSEIDDVITNFHEFNRLLLRPDFWR